LVVVRKWHLFPLSHGLDRLIPRDVFV
jgi:hypothetical protein